MNVLALDTETPRFDDKEKWRGNVYGDPRPIVCWSWATEAGSGAARWDWECPIYVQADIDRSDLVVGFNFKHDIAYLRREGVSFEKVKVWDVQLAEFVLGRQLNKFPSLSDTCLKYGIPNKLDVVKTEYWDKGLDTDQVPWPILSEYASHDAAVTLACYHAQLPLLTPRQRALVSLMSQDMLVLQEMERNGIKYDEQLCEESSLKLDDEISTITAKLKSVYPTVPLNFGSGDDLSSFLYGGQVVETIKVHDGFYKSGKKIGEPKLKNQEIVHQLPRLFNPIKGTELKKEGYYQTGIPILEKLKAIKKEHQWVLESLLRLSKLETLNSNYYKGIPLLNREMRWPKERVHGSFRQVQAITGRLSSVQPNQQNFASELQHIFISEQP